MQTFMKSPSISLSTVALAPFVVHSCPGWQPLIPRKDMTHTSEWLFCFAPTFEKPASSQCCRHSFKSVTNKERLSLFIRRSFLLSTSPSFHLFLCPWIRSTLPVARGYTEAWHAAFEGRFDSSLAHFSLQKDEHRRPRSAVIIMAHVYACRKKGLFLVLCHHCHATMA